MIKINILNKCIKCWWSPVRLALLQPIHDIRNGHTTSEFNPTSPPEEQPIDLSERLIPYSEWIASKKKQLLDVTGKVAIIAGGCTGICLATAAELLHQNAKYVLLTGTEPADGEDALKDLQRDFADRAACAEFATLDVTDSKQFEEVFRKTLHKHERLDMLFNVAAMMDDSRWEYEVDANINGLVRGVLLAFRYMGGRAAMGLPPLEGLRRPPPSPAGDEGDKAVPVVVNVACVVGLRPLASAPVYSLTQAAAGAITKGFGAQFHASRTGVRVVCLYTGMTAQDALLDDEDHLRPKLLEWEWAHAARTQLGRMPVQEARTAARAALHLVRHATSGSMWLVEDSQLVRLHRHSYAYATTPTATDSTADSDPAK